MLIHARGFRLSVALAVAGALLLIWPRSASGAEEGPGLSDHWEGSIELPTGALVVKVDLQRVGELWTGSVDIPQQGASGLPLDVLEAEGARAVFRIRGVPGDPTFHGTLEGDTLAGEFTQGPASFRFELTRGSAGLEEVLHRPQEPQPPLPYGSEEVKVRAAGGVTLAGTLTLPAGDGPHPAVVLLSGSGPQDRNEEIFGHKPFLVLADHLTRAGIAVLRLDDRGVGGSGGSLAGMTLDDLADDAAAAVRFLANRKGVAQDGIGLIGHSEGALVAPLAAARRGTKVAFLVLLASPGVTGTELLQQQISRLSRLQGGLSEGLLEIQDRFLADVLPRIAGGQDNRAVEAQLDRLAKAEIERLPGEQQAIEALTQTLKDQLPTLASPLLRSFLAHDPRPVLRKIKIPVLAAGGTLDLQVPADPNLDEIEKALAESGNEDATVRRMERLNHLFQAAKTGAPLEYGQIEETVSPTLLDLVTGWIRQRFGKGGGSP